MNHFPFIKGRAGFKGLLASGILAGALGLAMSDSLGTSGTGPGSNSPSNMPSSTTPGSQSSTPSDKTMGMANAQTGLPPNVSPGWKIRVCSEKTKADAIQFKLSLSDKKSNVFGIGKKSSKSSTQTSEETSSGGTGMETTAWNRGDSTLISVPEALRDADKIRIEAIPSQKDQKASICLLYNDHVTKKLDFDNQEVSTVKNTEKGECGC